MSKNNSETDPAVKSPSKAQIPKCEKLSPKHKKQLQASGIAENIICQRGYYTVTQKRDLNNLGFHDRQGNIPALVIPLCDLKGKSKLCQIRPDCPRKSSERLCKYEVPLNSKAVIDVPPAACQDVLDGKKPLLIKVGVKRADAAVSQGMCCVALLSLCCWKDQDFWSHVALKDRKIYLDLAPLNESTLTGIISASGRNLFKGARSGCGK